MNLIFKLLNNKLAWLVMFSIFNITAFILYPQIDIEFSNLFYRPGLGFIYNENIYLILIHRSIYLISYLTITYLILSLLYNIITRKKLFGLFSKKDLIYVALCFAIGPGLIVNYGFKDHIFGRARPCKIKEFGGEKNFTPAFTISDNCIKNCSFTSGHASLAFFLSAFAFIAKSRSRSIFTSVMIFSAIVGMGRIIQGGHFLSDIIFSGIIAISINMLLHFILYPDIIT